jgi:hypothetical protein
VEVVTLQVFVSLILVVGSVLLFAFSCRQRDFDHADRLALLPLSPESPSEARERAHTQPSPESPSDAREPAHTQTQEKDEKKP